VAVKEEAAAAAAGLVGISGGSLAI